MVKRSLAQQMKYCISQQQMIGHSKKAERTAVKSGSMNKGEQTSRIYSNGRSDALKDTSVDICKWLKANYPDVKQVVEIGPEHAQAWLNAKAERGCSQRSLDEYRSRLKKLQIVVEKTYKRSKGFSEGLIVPKSKKTEKGERIRDVAMSREDLEALLKSFRDRKAKTDAVKALELSSRSGLRIGECAILCGSDINLDARTIRVDGKNGKIRTIPIRDRDYLFYKEIKDKSDGGQICSRVKLDRHKGGEALDRAIRREMQRIGIDDKYPKVSTDHMVRKLFAAERMTELRGSVAKDPRYDERERIAWSQVQQELGHGSDLRIALYETYVMAKKG